MHAISHLFFRIVVSLSLLLAVFPASEAIAQPAAPAMLDLSSSSDAGGSSSDNVTNATTLAITYNTSGGFTHTMYHNYTNVINTSPDYGADRFLFGNFGPYGAGVHTFTMTSTDGSGTSAHSAPLTVTIDVTPPAAGSAPVLHDSFDTGTSDTDNITSDTPYITGSNTAGGLRVWWSLDNAALSGPVYLNGASEYGFFVNGLADGAHTIQIVQEDLAGNLSPSSAALTVTIDTLAPAAPTALDLDTASDTGNSTTDNLTMDDTPTISGTAEGNSIVTLSSNVGGVIGSATATAGGTWSVTSSALADGTHSITATATDLAGNTSGSSTGLTIEIDTVAPAAPAATPFLSSSSDSGASDSDNITSLSTLRFYGATTSDDYMFGLSVDGGATLGPFPTVVGFTSWGHTLPSPLSHGSHSIVTYQYDVAGNISPASTAITVNVDLIAPPTPGPADLEASSDLGGSASDDVTSDATPTFSGSAEANVSVILYSDVDGEVGSATATAAGAWSITSGALTDSIHLMTVIATDIAGNSSSASAPLPVTIDTVRPSAATVALAAATDTGASNSDRITNETTPIFSGITEAYASITLIGSLGYSGTLGTAIADSAGAWSFTPPNVAADGSYAVQAYATDLAGNASGDSPSYVSITIDTTAPAALGAPDLNAYYDSGASATDNVTNSRRPRFFGSSALTTDTITATSSVDGPIGTNTGSSLYQITPASDLSEGVHLITATATDLAGNVSPASTGLSVTIDVTPATASTIAMDTASDSGDSSSDLITNDTQPGFSGQAEPFASVRIDSQGASLATLGTATADASGSWDFTPSSAISEGVFTISANPTDLAGNAAVAPASATTITIDTTAPPAPGVPDLAAGSDSGSSNTDDVTNVLRPEFVGTADSALDTVRLYVAASGGYTEIGSGSGTAWSITPAAALPEAINVLRARSFDIAGNGSVNSGYISVTVSLEAPAAPGQPDLDASTDSGDSDTDNYTKDNAMLLTGLAEANSIVEISSSLAGVVGSVTANASGGWSLTTPALANGVHVFTATATNYIGNTSAASPGLTVTISALALASPTTPDLLAATDSGSSATDDITMPATVTLSGTTEPGYTVFLTSDASGALGSSLSDGAGNWSLDVSTLAQDTTHSITASARDLFGNTSAQSAPLVLVYDQTSPGLTLTTTAPSTHNGVIPVTATFTEDVSGFALANLSLGNSTASTLVAVSASVYTFNVAPSADGVVSVDGPAGLVDDIAGNASTAATTLSVTIDTQLPAVTLSTDANSPHSGSFTATATFSKPVSGFDLSDLSLSNGSASNLVAASATFASTYTFTVTPAADGAVTIDLPANAALDVSGNGNTIATQLNLISDSTAPVTPSAPSVTGAGGVTADNTPTLSGTAEPDSTVTIYDATRGALDTVVVASTGLWEWTPASALDDGDYEFSITATDAADNISGASTGVTLTIDATAPGVTLATAGGSLQSSAIAISITFTEAVTGFDVTDLTIGNGSAGNFQTVSTSEYTAEITATVDGLVAIDVGAGAAQDVGGNDNTAATTLNVTIDTVVPTVALSTDATSPHSGIFTVTATFSKPVTGFGLSDLSLSNGSASNLVTESVTLAASFAFDVTPTSDGTVTVDLSAGAAQDAAGNDNAPAIQLSITSDSTPPEDPSPPELDDDDSGGGSGDGTSSDTTPTLSGTGEPGSTVTISDAQRGELGTALIGSTLAQAAMRSGPLTTTSVGSWSWTPDTPLEQGSYEFSITVTDLAGNISTPSGTVPLIIDSVNPDVTLATAGGSLQSGVIAITITFTEDVTGFDVTDLTVGNGDAGNFQTVSASDYTANITPVADGEVTVDIIADVANDIADNGNTAAQQLSITNDTTAPEVQITGPTDAVTTAFVATITFTEDVTGFEQSDLSVANGTITSFSGTARIFEVTVDPVLGETVTIAVPANAALDHVGIPNTASNIFAVQAGSPATVFEDNRAVITAMIHQQEQQALTGQLASNQRLVRSARDRFMQGRQQQRACADGGQETCVRPETHAAVPFDITGSATLSNGNFASTGSFFEQSGSEDGSYRRLFFGDFNVQRAVDGTVLAHLAGRLAWEHMTSDRTMMGYFVGADINRTSVDGTFTGRRNGFGLMAGGYVVSALRETLFADAFVTLGLNRNTLDVSNGILDLSSTYGTQTLNLGGSLTGLIARDGYEIRPGLGFTYGLTNIGTVGFLGSAYGLTDDALSLDAGAVSVANLTFSPEFRIPMDGESVADTQALLTFAPRLLCERVQTTGVTLSCGAGAEVGLALTSENGQRHMNAGITFDAIAGATRAALDINFLWNF